MRPPWSSSCRFPCAETRAHAPRSWSLNVSISASTRRCSDATSSSPSKRLTSRCAVRQRRLALPRAPSSGDADHAHATILERRRARYEARVDERLQVARQRRAVHVERLGERTHRDAVLREHLGQQRELRDPQPRRRERPVVELRDATREAPHARAGAADDARSGARRPQARPGPRTGRGIARGVGDRGHRRGKRSGSDAGRRRSSVRRTWQGTRCGPDRTIPGRGERSSRNRPLEI